VHSSLSRLRECHVVLCASMHVFHVEASAASIVHQHFCLALQAPLSAGVPTPT